MAGYKLIWCCLLVSTLALSLAAPTDVNAARKECLTIERKDVSFRRSVKTFIERVSGRETLLDFRLDADLDGRLSENDIIAGLGVLSRERPAIVAIDPAIASAGEVVSVEVANPQLMKSGEFLLITSSGEHKLEIVDRYDSIFRLRLPKTIDSGVISRKRFPGLKQLDEQQPDPRAVALVIRVGGRVSNLCPFRVARPGEKDSDGDGLVDAIDTCPLIFDPMNGDTDGDGIGDMCDNCVVDVNPAQKDSNGDGSGDMCTPDFSVLGARGLKRGEVEKGGFIGCDNIGGKGALGLLVLTREISMEIREEIEGAGLKVVAPLRNFAFIVDVRACDYEKLRDRPYVHAFLPWRGANVVAADLIKVQNDGGGVGVRAEIKFSSEMTLGEAREALQKFGAQILKPGIELIGRKTGKVRRINIWQVLLPQNRNAISELLQSKGVLDVSTSPANQTFNDSAKDAINIRPVHAAGRTGTGMLVGEWDGGWAGGDNTSPPGASPGSAHPALVGRVMVRDHGTDEGIAVPAGCTAGTNVECGTQCNIGRHAMHVGGTIVGNGALIPTPGGAAAGPNDGMAPTANLISYEWPDNSIENICERTDAINFGTVSHNNSWGFCSGCTNMGRYHARTATYDDEIATNPQAAEVFAAGNEQNYRNSLFNQCTSVTDPACALPTLYTPGSCTAPPPGVTVPAGTTPSTADANRFYSVMAPGGTAKSVISVGNVDMVNNRLSPSSGMGPTRDGRIKPEVVGEGTGVVSTCDPGMTGCNVQGYRSTSGTSMAAPGITGTLAVLAEEAVASSRAFAADVGRALLAHTATDLGVTDAAGNMIATTSNVWANFTTQADGPDFLTGYGIVNAEAARDHVVNGNVAGMLKPTGCPTAVSYGSIPLVSPIEVGGAGPVSGCPAMIWDVVWYVDVPAGTDEFKVTLAWNDPAGAADSNPTIVNDIDLVLRSPTNQHHYSWWMDPACPFRPAARVQTAMWDTGTFGDGRNTLEQVHVVGGVETGTWKIIINTSGVASLTGTQPFALVVSMN